jgi:hypothetical protein
LRCPHCEYDLRLLTEMRCPECGRAFTWDTVRQAARARRDSALFEFHWRRRPVMSLLKTTWLALLPWRLWRHVPRDKKPRIGPLLALCAILPIATMLICLIVSIALHAVVSPASLPSDWIRRGVIGIMWNAWSESIQFGAWLLFVVCVFLAAAIATALPPTRAHFIRVAAYAWVTMQLWVSGAYIVYCALLIGIIMLAGIASARHIVAVYSLLASGVVDVVVLIALVVGLQHQMTRRQALGAVFGGLALMVGVGILTWNVLAANLGEGAAAAFLWYSEYFYPAITRLVLLLGRLLQGGW